MLVVAIDVVDIAHIQFLDVDVPEKGRLGLRGYFLIDCLDEPGQFGKRQLIVTDSCNKKFVGAASTIAISPDEHGIHNLGGILQ